MNEKIPGLCEITHTIMKSKGEIKNTRKGSLGIDKKKKKKKIARDKKSFQHPCQCHEINGIRDQKLPT